MSKDPIRAGEIVVYNVDVCSLVLENWFYLFNPILEMPFSMIQLLSYCLLLGILIFLKFMTQTFDDLLSLLEVVL